MSTLETNAIGKYSGDNVSVDDALNLKSYSTSARDALTSVAGDIIYNSDDSAVQVYDGTNWVALGAITQGAAITIDYLVIAGGGGGGEHGSRGAGGGGAGGAANSYNSETCGRFARSHSSLSLYKNLRYGVSIGAGGAGGTQANVMPFHGHGSTFHSVSVPGGSPGSDGHANGGRSHYGGSGGGGGGGANHQSGTYGRGNETYGFDGGNGQSFGTNNWQGGGGGSIATNGGGAVSGRGGNGGAGKIFTILSSSNATTSSVGEVSGTDVYYGGGGGGSGYSSTSVSSGGLGGGADGNVSSANEALNQGSPNTGGGGGAKGAGSATNAGSGGSGVVILRYPNSATMLSTGLTTQTFTEGTDKVTVITAGAGTVYWE